MTARRLGPKGVASCDAGMASGSTMGAVDGTGAGGRLRSTAVCAAAVWPHASAKPHADIRNDPRCIIHHPKVKAPCHVRFSASLNYFSSNKVNRTFIFTLCIPTVLFVTQRYTQNASLRYRSWRFTNLAPGMVWRWSYADHADFLSSRKK